MKANKKTLTLLGIATLFTAVVIGLYVFVFSAMKGKSESTVPLTDRIDELSSKEARINASLATLDKQKANIEKINAAFFKIDEIVLFTQKIEELGVQSKTDLVIESLEQGVGDKSAPNLSFRIRATGKFANIQRLLLLLENFPGKLDWKTVNLSRSAAGTSPDWNVDISLTALNFTN